MGNHRMSHQHGSYTDMLLSPFTYRCLDIVQYVQCHTGLSGNGEDHTWKEMCCSVVDTEMILISFDWQKVLDWSFLWKSVEGPQKYNRSILVCEVWLSERVSERETDSIGAEQINSIHIDTARWKNAISVLQRLRRGCFVMNHFWNPPQLLTQMERLERHLAAEPRRILIITVYAHILQVCFQSIRSRRVGLPSQLSQPALTNSQTATLKLCPQMLLFTLAHKGDMKHS